MTFTAAEMMIIGAALAAILMLGSRHLRANLLLFSVQTLFIAAATVFSGVERAEPHLYLVALAFICVKALGVPLFFMWIIRKIQVQSDTGTLLPAPMAMHLSIVLFGLSHLLTRGLPGIMSPEAGSPGAAGALSLLFSGLLLMLTRRVAMSQIVGFLTMENGIFLVALTQTSGMPLMVEMGILLDVLVGVMIAGLLLFRIKSSFEHIDVTQLTGLKD
ncbi:MAG TPA: hypothetical protein V6D08_16115 [Candidatus Obscuribacterales bacterium]